MIIPLIGIFVSLAVLVGLAYRGHSVVIVAPIAAIIATLFSGAPLLATYTQIFMPAAGRFITAYMPLFLCGAIFGHLMTVSGLASQLARSMSVLFGAQRALATTVLATALLTYGGVSAWVVVFTIMPIAMELFKEAHVPRRLMPAAIAFGTITFALAALPGSPQIHNAIPTKYFGTTTYAAPFFGLSAAAIMLVLGMAWLHFRTRQLNARGEYFEPLPEKQTRREKRKEQNGAAVAAPSTQGSENSEVGKAHRVVGHSEPAAKHETEHHGPGWIQSTLKEPGVSAGELLRKQRKRSADTMTKAEALKLGGVGLLPIMVVIVMNFLFVYVLSSYMNFDYLAEEKFGGVTLDKVMGTWSVVVALATAILLMLAMRPSQIRENIGALSEGAKTSILPAFTTASEVGYGAVVASLTIFTVIRDGMFSVSDNALVVSTLSTGVISGITGSASGGLSITMEAFGASLAQMASDQGISMEILHRVSAMASVSFDSLPHNGAVLTMLMVCGMTHRQSYKDVAMVTVVLPIAVIAAMVAGAMILS